MKILGKSAGGLIVEMSEDEIAKVSVFTSRYSNGFEAKIGAEFPVGQHWEDAQLVISAHARNVERFKDFSTDLSHLMALMAACEPKKKK